MAEDSKGRQEKIGRRYIEQSGGASAVIVGFKSDKSKKSPAFVYRQRVEKLFTKKEALVGAGVVLKFKVKGQEQVYFCICNNFRGVSLGPNGSRYEPAKALIIEPSETAILEA